MQDVVVFRQGKPTEIDNVGEFFSGFAADHTEEMAEILGIAAEDV